MAVAEVWLMFESQRLQSSLCYTVKSPGENGKMRFVIYTVTYVFIFPIKKQARLFVQVCKRLQFKTSKYGKYKNIKYRFTSICVGTEVL